MKYASILRDVEESGIILNLQWKMGRTEVKMEDENISGNKDATLADDSLYDTPGISIQRSWLAKNWDYT